MLLLTGLTGRGLEREAPQLSQKAKQMCLGGSSKLKAEDAKAYGGDQPCPALLAIYFHLLFSLPLF